MDTSALLLNYQRLLKHGSEKLHIGLDPFILAKTVRQVLSEFEECGFSPIALDATNDGKAVIAVKLGDITENNDLFLVVGTFRMDRTLGPVFIPNVKTRLSFQPAKEIEDGNLFVHIIVGEILLMERKD